MFIIGLIVGLLIGSMIRLLAFSLLSSAKIEDLYNEIEEKKKSFDKLRESFDFENNKFSLKSLEGYKISGIDLSVGKVDADNK